MNIQSELANFIEPVDLHKSFNKGETIFSEGEHSDCAYIIEQGEIDLFILVSGRPTLIKTLSSGQIFGEMSLINSQLRSATAIATTDTKLITIPKKYFDEKIDAGDKFLATLLNVLLERYYEMRTRLENIARYYALDPNFTLYTPDNKILSEGAYFPTQQLEAENNLRYAFRHKQLVLYYQPIISFVDGRIVGCEALIRWQHPELGLIPPIDFINIAEETDLIIPIGLWIIEEACSAYKRLCAELLYPLDFISINLSGKQFVPPDLVSVIQAIFIEQGINPKNIKFEITESILMANPLKTIHILNELKNMGCHIAIDDFGTGYSSFSYLHRFPIDTLKIDKSFVSTMLDNAKSFEIVKTLSLLAKSIGMNIVAEGIENSAEGSCLKALNVDYGQGYLYAKPLPEAQFYHYVQEHNWHLPTL